MSGPVGHHEVRAIVPIVAPLECSARIGPKLTIDKFLVEQQAVIVTRLALHPMDELADFLAEFEIAGQASIGRVKRTDRTHGESGAGQFVAGRNLFVHEAVELVPESRGIVDTKEDGHVGLRRVEHPVGDALILQLSVQRLDGMQQAVSVFGREGVTHIGIHRERLANRDHLAGLAGFENIEQPARARDRLNGERLRVASEAVLPRIRQAASVPRTLVRIEFHFIVSAHRLSLRMSLAAARNFAMLSGSSGVVGLMKENKRPVRSPTCPFICAASRPSALIFASIATFIS